MTNLQLDVDAIAVSDTDYSARVNELSFQEASGFRLASMTADIRIDSTQSVLNAFDLQTANSRVRMNVKTDYPSLATVGQDLKQTRVTASIGESYVGMADINLFSPSMQLPDSGKVSIEAEAVGVVDDLTFETLKVSTLSGTALQAKGNIRNVSTPDNLSFYLTLEKFSTNSGEVMALVADI